MVSASQKQNGVIKQSLRFLIAGGVVFLFDFAIFAAILWIMPDRVLEANVAGKLGGATLGFFAHKYWTFSWDKNHSGGSQIAGYIALFLFNLLLSTALVAFLVFQLELRAPLGKLVSDAIIVVTSFLVSRNVIFRNGAANVAD